MKLSRQGITGRRRRPSPRRSKSTSRSGNSGGFSTWSAKSTTTRLRPPKTARPQAPVTVLIDTTIWSLALRRRSHQLSPEEKGLVEEWERLVTSGRAVLAGPIRQEVLSGVQSEKMFEALQERLSTFRYLEVLPGDYDQAARFLRRRAGQAAEPRLRLRHWQMRRKPPAIATPKTYSHCVRPRLCRGLGVNIKSCSSISLLLHLRMGDCVVAPLRYNNRYGMAGRAMQLGGFFQSRAWHAKLSRRGNGKGKTLARCPYGGFNLYRGQLGLARAFV